MSTVIITGSTTLRGLNVSGNDIGDSPILVIKGWLLSNKTLTKLNVARCKLSVKGTVLYTRCIDIFHGRWMIGVNLSKPH